MEIEIVEDKTTEEKKLVMPSSVHDHFEIKDGDKFIAVEKNGKLMLLKVWFNTDREEDIKLMRRMMEKCQAHAKKHGLTEKDMWDAIAKVRAAKRTNR